MSGVQSNQGAHGPQGQIPQLGQRGRGGQFRQQGRPHAFDGLEAVGSERLSPSFEQGTGKRCEDPEARLSATPTELNTGILFEDGRDRCCQRRVVLPHPQLPPPPWPPTAAPGEVDLECAVGGCSGATNGLRVYPPPPPVDVIRANQRTRDGAAVGTDNLTSDDVVPAPFQPPPPPIRRNDNGSYPELCPLAPGAILHRDGHGLKFDHIVGCRASRAHNHLQRAWTFLKLDDDRATLAGFEPDGLRPQRPVSPFGYDSELLQLLPVDRLPKRRAGPLA